MKGIDNHYGRGWMSYIYSGAETVIGVIKETENSIKATIENICSLFKRIKELPLDNNPVHNFRLAYEAKDTNKAFVILQSDLNKEQLEEMLFLTIHYHPEKKIIEILLNKKVDPNATNAKYGEINMTPLTYLFMKEYFRICLGSEGYSKEIDAVGVLLAQKGAFIVGQLEELFAQVGKDILPDTFQILNSGNTDMTSLTTAPTA